MQNTMRGVGCVEAKVRRNEMRADRTHVAANTRVGTRLNYGPKLNSGQPGQEFAAGLAGTAKT